MRSRLVAALCAGFLALSAPVGLPVRASEPIPGRPLPDEGITQLLGDQVAATLPFDLDGDGSRELVAAASADDEAGFAAIEAWWIEADGTAERSNQVRLRRTDPEGAMTAVRLDEPARLFTAIRDGREVPLVAGIGTRAPIPVQCCVTIWEVRADGRTEISLELVATTRAHGTQLVPADLDADGTDELVVTESTDNPPGNLVVGILRWDGTRYLRTRTELPTPLTCCFLILDAGETDGVAGDDVLLFGLGDDGPGLIRLTMRGGLVVQETVRPQGADLEVIQSGRVLSPSTGPALLTGTNYLEVLQWTWPRDQSIELVASRSPFGSTLAVLGTGADRRIVTGMWPDPSSVTVMGESPDVARATFGADIRAQVFRSLVEGTGTFDAAAFAGEVPGGLPGLGAAYIFGGKLIWPSAGQGMAEARSIATLAGRDLAGAVGPEGVYMAVLNGSSSDRGGYGFEGAPNPRVTDLLIARIPRSLHLVETAAVLEPETADGVLAPTFIGAAPDPERPLNLRVANEAVSAEIIGPPGTRIGWSNEEEQQETVLGAGGVARLPLMDALARDVPDGPVDQVSIWLVTPAGHAYRGTWVVSVYRQPPDLVVDDLVPFFDIAPMVSGRTVAGSTVTVDGRPGSVDSDGFFSVPVDVGVLPTEIRVVVTDQLDNQTERVVTRLWPLDYRQLPWIPLTVALTVAAGVVLFVRTPGTGRGERRTPDDDSPFEEIGG